MSSSEKKTDEARARRLEIQREIHLRQLTLIQVATMAGLAAFGFGCLLFRERIWGEGAFVQIGLTMSAILALGVVWRWFVFHSRRIRSLDKAIGVITFGEDKDDAASIPGPMTVYSWMLAAATATLAFTLFLVRKEMGVTILAALFVGCMIALLGSADQKLKDQNDAAEENLAEREAGAPAGQGKETIQAADGG